MPGLDPGIHVSLGREAQEKNVDGRASTSFTGDDLREDVDGRDKPGHDEL
jgi:hypothetical protein